MRIIAWQATDVGRVRSQNEDSCLIDEELGLYLVADGMGGHAGGAHASQLCVDVVNKIVSRDLGRIRGDLGAVSDLLVNAAAQASARVYDSAAENIRLRGMGTTLTGLLLSGDRAFVVHVGDSRAFLLRGGMAQQLTRDHSWLSEQVEAGMLTQEEADASDLKHIITRSIGFERHVVPDVEVVRVGPGDAFLLCSDGMSNYITEEEIAALARSHWYSDLPALCIDLANRRGGDDNITVVVALLCNDQDRRRITSARRSGAHRVGEDHR